MLIVLRKANDSINQNTKRIAPYAKQFLPLQHDTTANSR